MAESNLKEELARIVLERAVEHLPGWLDTLGELGGKPKGKKIVPPSTRVSAAKTGIDFLNRFLGEAGDSLAGQELLRKLGEIEEIASTEDEEA